MNPIILGLLVVSGAVAFGLFSVFVAEYYDLFPGERNNEKKLTDNRNSQTIADYQKTNWPFRKRYPDDFLDLSGGSLGL